MGRRARKPLPTEPAEALIESLAQDGRGVAHLEGKAVFIHGVLPGERVRFTYERISRRHDEGRLHSVLHPSPDRVEPRCPHFGVCGGCGLQHQRAERQIGDKQRVLADALERVGRVDPEAWLPPLVAGCWGYRRKARLGAKYVAKKGRMLVGFRERNASFVTDLDRCEVLHPKLGERLQPLKALLEGLAIRSQVPQVEMSMGDTTCALIFRVLQRPGEEDRQRLRRFGAEHGFVIYLQPGGPDSVQPLEGAGADLCYTLPALDLRLCFSPQDFTQINLELNRLMVERALALLEPQPEERVLDLFCGMGNFSLPLGRRAGQVTGVEGEAGLVARARQNAAANHVDNARFYAANLYQVLDGEPWMRERFDAALLDPPRSGALQILPQLPRLGVERLLYVSCYPATLARDAGVLVNELGYRMRKAGVMDMFPHTTHVESIALFERG
jgi:23S rRNA (uracil1939-C5)-methyltransferase